MGIVFVTGIDTGIGKSIATGLMARWLARRGRPVITQKLVQTGCRGAVAEDIAVHRRLMGTGLFDVDRDGTTCPCVFAYPASPHLAARLENREVDISAIDRASDRLAAMHEHVLVEGVGGVLVPLAGSLSVLDYVAAPLSADCRRLAAARRHQPHAADAGGGRAARGRGAGAGAERAT